MILSSTISTLALLIPFNSTDKDYQFISQLRASVEEIRNNGSTSNNIIPIPISLPIPVTTFNMVLNRFVSKINLVPIFNIELTNTTILRTDTFPYGTAPSFLRKFPIGDLRSDPGASSYGIVPSEIQYGVFPLRPDTLQYGTNLTTSDSVPLLSDLVPFSLIQGFKSPRLDHSPKTFRKNTQKIIFSYPSTCNKN